MIIASLCALFIVEAMQAIPGNRYFTGTVEFGTLINFYFGPTAHILGQFGLYGALQTMAIGSLIQSSQTMDNLFIDMFGETCGVSLSVNNVTNKAFEWYCVSDHGVTLSPFGNEYMLFTAGYLGAFLIIFPMCIYPLEDIVWIQTLTFAVTMIVFVEWIVVSGIEGLHTAYVPTLGQSSGYAGLVGVVMLNYAFVQTIPAWVNVRRPDVNINQSVWISSGCGFATYIVTGVIPAMAYQIPDGSNLIQVMQSSGGVVTKVFGYLFSTMVLMMSVPVFFVVCKSNLEQNFKMNKFVSVGLSYVVPWALTIPFATGTYLSDINVWGSLIFVSMANFIIPLGIYFKAVSFRTSYNERRYLTKKQRDLLKVIHGKGYGPPALSAPGSGGFLVSDATHAASPDFSHTRDLSIPVLLLHEPEQEAGVVLVGPSMRVSPEASPLSSRNSMLSPVEQQGGSGSWGMLSVPGNSATTFSTDGIPSSPRRVVISVDPSPMSLATTSGARLPSELFDLDVQQESYLLEDVPDPEAEDGNESDDQGAWFRHLFGAGSNHPHDSEHPEYSIPPRQNSRSANDTEHPEFSAPPRPYSRSDTLAPQTPTANELMFPPFGPRRPTSSSYDKLAPPHHVSLLGEGSRLSPNSILQIPRVVTSPFASPLVSPTLSPAAEGGGMFLSPRSPSADGGSFLSSGGLPSTMKRRNSRRLSEGVVVPAREYSAISDSGDGEENESGLHRVPKRYMTISSQVAEETYARAAMHLAETSGKAKHSQRKFKPINLTFRSIPKSFPIAPRTLAMICLVVSCGTALTNIVYTIMT
ncbi:hypothetical protein HDU98_011738 [Podochytrium sp. JEL0797]|nr:hypothetical protein HDU98_011738 [Podochytrium sp. JEL0797]